MRGQAEWAGVISVDWMCCGGFAEAQVDIVRLWIRCSNDTFSLTVWLCMYDLFSSEAIRG